MTCGRISSPRTSQLKRAHDYVQHLINLPLLSLSNRIPEAKGRDEDRFQKQSFDSSPGK